jgi:hypothetical protein
VRLSGEHIGRTKIQCIKRGSNPNHFYALKKSCAQHELCEKVAEVVNSATKHKSTVWGVEKVVFQMPLLRKAPLR